MGVTASVTAKMGRVDQVFCFKLLFLLLTLGLLASCKPFLIGYNQDYAPEQPIPFDHALHATTNKIDCKFCHTGTLTSRHASVPSLDTCMKCHQSVATQKPEVQKLIAAYNENRSIAWNKVHMLPDFVFFSHVPHVRRKGLSCNECHGPVEEMTRVYQHAPLSMGWCVSCHRSELQRYEADVKAGAISKDSHREVYLKGLTNCSTCHQ